MQIVGRVISGYRAHTPNPSANFRVHPRALWYPLRGLTFVGFAGESAGVPIRNWSDAESTPSRGLSTNFRQCFAGGRKVVCSALPLGKYQFILNNLLWLFFLMFLYEFLICFHNWNWKFMFVNTLYRGCHGNFCVYAPIRTHCVTVEFPSAKSI